MEEGYREYIRENRSEIGKAAVMGIAIVVIAVLVICIFFKGLGISSEESEAVPPRAGGGSNSLLLADDNDIIPTAPTGGALYMVTDYTGLYSEIPADIDSAYAAALAYEGEYFASYTDMGRGDMTEGRYVPVVYGDSTLYLPAEKAVKIEGAVIMPTKSYGQLGGEYYAYSGCGPAVAAALVNSEKGAKWDKDELLEFCSDMGYDDMGSMLSLEGGMSIGSLVKLINEYSGGDYIAENDFSIDSINTLKALLDEGHRVIVSVRYVIDYGVVDYDVSWQTGVESATHFVVICGYANQGRQLTFYYADPYYYSGGESLCSVSAFTLEGSIDEVTGEEPGMVILK